MPEKILIRLGRMPAIRKMLRTPFAAHVAGLLIIAAIKRIDKGDKPNAINVLVFNSMRFRQDIEVLARHPRLRLYAMPTRAIELVQAIFSDPGHTPRNDYYLEEDPVILALREKIRAYIAIIAPYLKLRGLDCSVTPSIQYNNEQDWAAGLDAGGFPFIGLHKEFTISDEKDVVRRIGRHRELRRKFLGSYLLVTNENARRLFSESSVFPREKIQVMGLLRMDRLFDPNSPYRRRKNQKPQAILFSFGHFSGGIASPEKRSHYFSQNDDFGFVQLFGDVHAAFAEMAIANPDVDFKIKPKNVEDWWIREIEAVTRSATGRSISEIPNLSIVSTTAPELIRDASVVIGFNSTVLLESLILGRMTVLPVFAEAATKYPDNVHLIKYREAFSVASSKAELKELIGQGIANQASRSDAGRMHEMMQFYLGFDDGRSLDRFVRYLDEYLATDAGKLKRSAA